MTRLPLRSRSLVATLLLSAILPSTGLAQHGGSASGRVDVVLGDGLLRTVTVIAEAGADGTAAGRIEFQSFEPMPDQDVDGTGDPQLAGSRSGVTALAEVNCLVVVGDMAVVGGRVTEADPARYVGKQLLLLVEDSQRARGRFAFGFYERNAGVSCGSFPLAAYTPVESVGGALAVQP